MFSKKVVINKDSIKAEAESGLSLFRVAINKLKSASDKSNNLQMANQSQIDDLTQENEELATLVQDNAKVIDNISKLIGE